MYSGFKHRKNTILMGIISIVTYNDCDIKKNLIVVLTKESSKNILFNNFLKSVSEYFLTVRLVKGTRSAQTFLKTK